MISRPVLLLLAAGALVVSPAIGSAQITSLDPGPGTVGERTARSSTKSEADLQRAEREGARVRKADEARYKRRDDNMHRSLGSICRGC